jgi:hypothetical protein
MFEDKDIAGGHEAYMVRVGREYTVDYMRRYIENAPEHIARAVNEYNNKLLYKSQYNASRLLNFIAKTTVNVQNYKNCLSELALLRSELRVCELHDDRTAADAINNKINFLLKSFSNFNIYTTYANS